MTCHQHEVLLCTILTVNYFVLCYKNISACVSEKFKCVKGGSLDLLGGPSLFYERLCLCMNRCKPPLCVKLENPELSRKECDHSLYCSLLHSGKCVYVCVREKDGIRGTEVNVRRKTSLRAETKGQMSLHDANSFRSAHVDDCWVCFQSGSEGVFAVIPPRVMWLE